MCRTTNGFELNGQCNATLSFVSKGFIKQICKYVFISPRSLEQYIILFISPRSHQRWQKYPKKDPKCFLNIKSEIPEFFCDEIFL